MHKCIQRNFFLHKQRDGGGEERTKERKIERGSERKMQSLFLDQIAGQGEKETIASLMGLPFS